MNDRLEIARSISDIQDAIAQAGTSLSRVIDEVPEDADVPELYLWTSDMLKSISVLTTRLDIEWLMETQPDEEYLNHIEGLADAQSY